MEDEPKKADVANEESSGVPEQVRHRTIVDNVVISRYTAVKRNALAELMNRASKIHWKNLS